MGCVSAVSFWTVFDSIVTVIRVLGCARILREYPPVHANMVDGDLTFRGGSVDFEGVLRRDFPRKPRGVLNSTVGQFLPQRVVA